MAASSCLLRVEEIGGKGRGVVAAQPLKAGQTLLTESPLIVYSASPLFSSPPFKHCHHCFTIIPSHTINPPSCPSCSHHLFCSQTCLNSSSHSPWACKALTSLTNSTPLQQQPQERQVQARFVVAAHDLLLHTPSHINMLLSLQGTPDAAIIDAANFLHSLISPLFPPHSQLSADLVAQLMAKDRLNSFCLMHPYSPHGPQRSIKAYTVYAKASLFNHSCLPNACRFDYVDTSEEHNTDIVVRLVEDVPEGKEVCISYIRVGRDYCTRKRILMEDYGFTCECDRCKIEASWGSQGEKENNDLPHVRFLRKHVCEKENCAGTMAPLPPPSHVLECNFCGNFKTHCDTP
ncbi:histone-lysine N-methyltransferase ASHR2 [Cajanus cajan]|uniref:Histone-lysine N-methyltransferase ASHR2 n=1 Tax=Cajanus cajan TaxID=3821 RepID=A0A151THH4_CAJCA|nr:histone-lysine N-methyltransferase ASHR2 [Cajanus cajan]KYP66478.1 Histone-lysine N-methyltransferase ASHR2 [Cajanus cajan]